MNLPLVSSFRTLLAHRLPSILAALCLLGACAKQAPPPGGPEDRVAPELLRVNPPAGAVGVSLSQPVRLVFTKSMRKPEVELALHFFPPPTSPPDLHWEGRDLVVTPDTIWDSGQTYIVTLQSEAVDLRGNRLRSTFQTAFSTGSQIDSGGIEGQILRDARPVAGVMALCYRLPSAHVNPETDTADYVVQTDSEGRFRFGFLNSGLYRIFGLDDRDRDWLWNIGTEEIAVPALDLTLQESGQIVPLPALHLARLDTVRPALAECLPLSESWLKLRFDGNLDSSILDTASALLVGPHDTTKADLLLLEDSTGSVVFARFPFGAKAEVNREIIWRMPGGAQRDQACLLDGFVAADEGVALARPRMRPDTSLLWPFQPEQVFLWFDQPVDSLRSGFFLSWPGKHSASARLENPFLVKISLEPGRIPSDTVLLALVPGAVVGSNGGNWPVLDTEYIRLPVWPFDSLGEFEIFLEGIATAAQQTVQVTLRSLTGRALSLRFDLGESGRILGSLARGDYALAILADGDGHGRWSAGWPSPFVPSERLWFPADTLRVRARFTTEFNVSLVR